MGVALVVPCALGAATMTLASRRLVFRLAVPTGQPPRSMCPACHTAFPHGPGGWLAPRRRCPRCRARLGGAWWSYALAAAGAGGLLAWRLPHATTRQGLLLAAWLAFAVAGVALCAVDIQVRRLPTPIIVATAAVDTLLVAVAAIAAGAPRVLGVAALGGATVGIGYLVLALAVPAGFGLGAVRLAALAGLLLGTNNWHAVALGAVGPFLLAAPVTGALLALRRIHRTTAVPFGVPVVAGAILTAAILPWPAR